MFLNENIYVVYAYELSYSVENIGNDQERINRIRHPGLSTN